MDSRLQWRTSRLITCKYIRLFAEAIHFLTGASSAEDPRVEQIEHMMNDYGTTVKRICLMYLKDHGLAEEAAQDTFVKAYFKMNALKNERAVKAWLYAVAVNTCKDYLRRSWIKQRGRDVSLDQLYIDPSACAEDRLLVEAISSLDNDYKAVILMHYYQGLRVSEISEQLHCSQSSVYRRLEKAEQLLRDYMEE